MSNSTDSTLPPTFYEPKPTSNKDATILGVSITLLILVLTLCMFRIYARVFIAKTPGADDILVVLAVLCVAFGVITFCVSTRYGMGDHFYLLDPSQIEAQLLFHYLIGNAYTLATAFIKLSLLCQYLRVFEPRTLTHRFSQAMIVLVGIWGFVYSFLTWFCCFPSPSAFWKGTMEGCYGFASPEFATVTKWIESHGAINMIFDLIVLSIPFRILFIKDSPINKYGLAALLSMGTITCAFSIWRLESIVASNAGESADLTWVEPEPFLLSFVEVCIASICACVPFFWPVIKASVNKIMVMYEFQVTTEERYHDEEVELANSGSWPAGSKAGSKDEVRSMERSMDGDKTKQKNGSYYRDDFVQNQVNPFSQEFKVDTTASAGTQQKKKKGGFIKFDPPV